MIRELKNKVSEWWYHKKLEEDPQEVLRRIKEIMYPPQVEWNLTRLEVIELDTYIGLMVERKVIEYESMDEIDSAEYPNLYILGQALRGLTDKPRTYAAMDYLLTSYPELAKLADEIGD